MELLIALMALGIIDVVAVRWGSDSREGIDSAEWARRAEWAGSRPIG
ncbi:MAG: hypothetical protein M3Z04_18420 [Chloroflexota bacterium]|nr:hypothetical protein [Chloroflexota bacterium]